VQQVSELYGECMVYFVENHEVSGFTVCLSILLTHNCTPERWNQGNDMTKRPLDILDHVLNRQPVLVSLKGGREIRGVLQGYDVHMNLVLDKAEEMENGQVQKVGTLIVRGDNVIYISPSIEQS